jgi:hypothetical protein
VIVWLHGGGYTSGGRVSGRASRAAVPSSSKKMLEQSAEPERVVYQLGIVLRGHRG